MKFPGYLSLPGADNRLDGLTLQGMTAVKPGRRGMTPEALNCSPPAVRETWVRRKVASPLIEPRK